MYKEKDHFIGLDWILIEKLDCIENQVIATMKWKTIQGKNDYEVNTIYTWRKEKKRPIIVKLSNLRNRKWWFFWYRDRIHHCGFCFWYWLVFTRHFTKITQEVQMKVSVLPLHNLWGNGSHGPKEENS